MLKLTEKELLFIRNLIFTVILGGIIGFLNYLFNIFIARNSTENIFGIFSAATGIIYLLQIPGQSIQAIITKTVGQQKNADWKYFKVKSLLIFTFLGLIFSLLFYTFRDSVVSISHIPDESIVPLTLVLFFAFISSIYKGMLLGKEKIITVNLLFLSETVLRFLIGYISINMTEDITLLILANALPGVIFTVFVLPFIKLGNQKVTKKDAPKPVLNYKNLILMTVSFLLLNTPYTLDLILVNPDIRAEYSALTLVGKMIFFAAITISSVMFARLVNQKKDKNERRTLFISITATLLIGLGLSFVFYILKDLLALLIFDGKYNDISTLIPIYSICMALYASVFMLVNFLIAEDSYWFNLVFIFTSGLQIYLFSLFNSNLELVVRNQVIVYITLFILMCIILYFKIKTDGKDKK